MDHNLYNEIIMDHYLMPNHKYDIDDYDYEQKGINPSCGDEITVKIKFDNNVIKDIAFTGKGCAISQASTSIMIDLLIGKDVKEANILIKDFLDMLNNEKTNIDNLGDAQAFSNIANMPSRIKCANLAWRSIKNIIKDKNV